MGQDVAAARGHRLVRICFLRRDVTNIEAMGILRYVGTRKGPDGRPLITYGYRFWHRGRLYKAMAGPVRDMAVEAEKRERARLSLADFEGRWGPRRPRLTKLEDAVTHFLEAKAHKASLDHDAARLRWWIEFLTARGLHYLQELDPDAIMAGRRALEADGMAPGTVYQYFAVLRTLCQLAIRRWRILRENPLFNVDWPKPKPSDVRLPTGPEFRKLLREAGRILKPVILTAVYTGLREGAVIKLTGEDRKYRRGWLRGSEEKGDKTVWIYETAELKQILDGQRAISGPLFRWEDGRSMSRFPRKRWNLARVAAGIPWFRFRHLRHMAGQLLAEEDVPIRTIQKYLGHSGVQVTERYTQQLAGPLKRASRKLSRRIASYRGSNRRAGKG